MIKTRLFGGLGNQMFQYAVGRALSLRLKTNLGLDSSWFDDNKYLDTNRQFGLDAFNIASRKLERVDLKGIKLRRFFSKFGLSSKNYIKEKYFNFNKDIVHLSDDVYLDGYWQSEKYFSDFEETIKNDFNLRYPLSREAAGVHEIIIHAPVSCAIHIRRGDYVVNPGINFYHGACSLRYYRDAVDYIKKYSLSTEVSFFVFSDDINWVKKNFIIEKGIFIEFENRDGFKDQEEMILMSRCQHQIIANSTFSWWGAWLNKNKQKIILAPDKWFNNVLIDTKDLLPDSWIKIKRD
ncbi:MAG: hypothetical protein A2418_02955 [Candidatus Brennerbacteria bacterium RIFOXYC1_FULL_41_11]|nr:MAG: hypothetical protein A2418_02955 [Candidatus Brennerbacteria bacterium RIFOXYC1_FULL_41_11]